MSIGGINSSTSVFRWQYSDSSQSTNGEETQKTIFAKNNNKLLNQDGDTTGIQLDGTDQSKSAVNNKASTSYIGEKKDTLQVQLSDTGEIQKNIDVQTNEFAGFIEFDMLSEANQGTNPFASTEAQNFNRVSQETRDKFTGELTALKDGGDLTTVLSSMSDSEIILLNHFGGNVFLSDTGNLYRQPTDEEVLAGKFDWIQISSTSDEYKVRMEAMKRLSVVSTDVVPSENDVSDEVDPTFKVVSPTVEEAKTDFYKGTMPLASVIAVADVPAGKSNALVTEMLGDDFEKDDKMRAVLNTSEYINSYYPTLSTSDISSLVNETQTKFGDELAGVVESLKLKDNVDKGLAIGVTDKEVTMNYGLEDTTFTLNSKTYKAIHITENTDTENIKFLTTSSGVAAVKVQLEDDSTMYFISKTSAVENKSFEEIYNYIKDTGTFTEANATVADTLVIPYLNFSKTMSYTDDKLSVVDVQKFVLNNTEPTATNTATDAQAAHSFDLTNKDFVCLIVGKDQDTPHYGIDVSGENKEKMFVVNG